MSETALIKEVGERVRMIRKEKSIRQTTAGHLADIDKQHMSKIEFGLNIQMFTLYRISVAMEWSMAYVLDINNEITEPRLFRKRMEMDKVTVLKNIGANITRLREERKLAPNKLSKILRKDTIWLVNRELGTVDFTLNTLHIISKGLGVSMSCVVDIYGEIKTKASSPQSGRQPIV